MTSLTALICSTVLASTDSSSLDNAIEVALGAGGLSKNSAVFDPVALSYYRTGEFAHPVSHSLAQNPWHLPRFMNVVGRDSVLATGQPHKILASASRLSLFGSRRDLLSDPSTPFLQSNADGTALNRVIERYRSAGIITDQIESQGIIPDDIKRALAIILDSTLSQKTLFDATFPNEAEKNRLMHLTRQEAFTGGNANLFSEWLNLAKKTDLSFLIAGSQDLAATINAVKPMIENAQLIGNFSFKLKSKWGDILISDSTAQTTDLRKTFIVIDLGGDDTYLNGSESWCSIVIDRAGKDSYLSDLGYKGKPIKEGSGRASQRLQSGPGRGFFGMSYLVDLDGDDLYRSASQAFGSATFGVGYMFDASGNDIYDTYSNSLGFGMFGLGILEDQSGDDQYSIFTQGQGCGLPGGVGWLIDRKGNDKYIAEDQVLDFKSPQTAEHNVSMAQGAGYGIRLDYLFGHSLAGGMGFLFDLEGKDSYSAGVFAQGTGYWMGIGGLWDREGDDQYRSVWYGQGSAAHFATGYLQDDDGNDTYSGLINMTQGAGHDFSVGMLIDSAGNDQYSGNSLALGAGNANGFGIFIDMIGDDAYTALGRTSLGAANENPEGSLRNFSLCLGLFLDRSGKDTYNSPQSPYAKNGGKNKMNPLDAGAIGVFWDQ